MQAFKVAVIGAGPMGLACAYELLKHGAGVTIYERDDRIGGMSASFDFDGLTVERYYHFICKPDRTLFEYLKELQIYDRLRWRATKMGFYYHGRLYPWGNPLHLLTFPHLGLSSKLRYGLHALYATRVKDWQRLDRITANAWLRRWVGARGYEVLWRKLFELKFFEFQESLSAAWLGTRIQRVGLSRKNAFAEELGYLEGGSDTLLRALKARIDALGADVRLSTDVRRIRIDGARVAGVELERGFEPFDAVVSTIPLPYLVRLANDLPEDERLKIAAIQNIGVVCVLLKLKSQFTENFWTNINDPRIQIPGLIEYSNLNPLRHTLLYAPFYMPVTHPKYSRSKEEFIEEVLGYLPLIKPSFRADEVLAVHASRYEFAQTICGPGFYDMLPNIQSSVHRLFMADTSHYYPEDRSISESFRVGRAIAAMVTRSFSHRAAQASQVACP